MAYVELIDLEHHIVFDKGEIIPNNETGMEV